MPTQGAMSSQDMQMLIQALMSKNNGQAQQTSRVLAPKAFDMSNIMAKETNAFAKAMQKGKEDNGGVGLLDEFLTSQKYDTGMGSEQNRMLAQQDMSFNDGLLNFITQPQDSSGAINVAPNNGGSDKMQKIQMLMKLFGG